MAQEERQRVNTKDTLIAYVEYDVNKRILASEETIQAVNEDTQDAKKAESLRADYNTLREQATAFGIAPVNVDKVLAMSVKAKPIIEELKALNNEQARRYHKALELLGKQIPPSVFKHLMFRWEEDGESPIGGRLVLGKALGGVGRPHGFTAEWLGKSFVYTLPKHKAEARLKVFEDGRATISIIKDGKATSHEATSPSQAAILLHKACNLTKANGEAWAPTTQVWQEVKA